MTNIQFIDLLDRCETPKEMEIAVEGAFTADMCEWEIIHNLIGALHLVKCERDKVLRHLELAEAALLAQAEEKEPKFTL